MFKTAVGHSLRQDPEDAVEDLLAQCQPELTDHPPSAGLLFSSHGLDHARMLQNIRQRYPDLPLVGCSSLGEVSSRQGYQTDSSTLLLLQTDRIRITAGVAVVNAFQQVLGMQTPLFGAAAADRWTLSGTDQFYNQTVLQRSVPFLLFHGPLRIASGVTQGLGNGWMGLGDKVLAEVEGNQIHRIAGQPAAEFFQTQFTLQAHQLSLAHPLAVYLHHDSECHLLRNAVAYDPVRGTVQLAQSLPKRVWVQLTLPMPEAILAATRKTLLQVMAEYQDLTPAQPAAALWFSCASRALVLNGQAHREFADAIQPLAGLPPLAGCYGYGEIAPGSDRGKSLFHSSSLAVLLLGEDPSATPRHYHEEVNASLLLAEIQRLQQANAELQAALTATRQDHRRLQAQLTELRKSRGFREHETSLQSEANKLLIAGLLLRCLERQGGTSRDWFKGEQSQLNIAGLVRSILREAERRGIEAPVSGYTLRRYLEELMGL